jgi:hypothetical protein
LLDVQRFWHEIEAACSAVCSLRQLFLSTLLRAWLTLRQLFEEEAASTIIEIRRKLIQSRFILMC